MEEKKGKIGDTGACRSQKFGGSRIIQSGPFLPHSLPSTGDGKPCPPANTQVTLDRPGGGGNIDHMILERAAGHPGMLS